MNSYAIVFIYLSLFLLTSTDSALFLEIKSYEPHKWQLNFSWPAFAGWVFLRQYHLWNNPKTAKMCDAQPMIPNGIIIPLGHDEFTELPQTSRIAFSNKTVTCDLRCLSPNSTLCDNLCFWRVLIASWHQNMCLFNLLKNLCALI